MRTHMMLVFATMCTSISIMSMDPNAAMRQRQAEMQRQMEQLHRDQVNAATARNYQMAGQPVPQQLMMQLDAGARTIAQQHNHTLAQRGK